MHRTYYRILFHLIWGTKNRYRYLKPEIRPQLFTHIIEYSKRLPYTQIIEINGWEDHIHTLVSTSPKHSLSWIVNKLKGESSHWMNEEKLVRVGEFGWAEGFGAFSVSESQIEKVREYIRNQEEHHKRLSFEEEYQMFIKKYKVEVYK